MNDKISQDEINSILWRACDTFRGTVDPAEYKNYILVMLFVKCVSDVWHDHYAEAKRQFADEERVLRRMQYEKFKLPQDCHLKERNHGPRYYELLNRVLPDWRERREKLNAFEFA